MKFGNNSNFDRELDLTPSNCQSYTQRNILSGGGIFICVDCKLDLAL